LEKIISYEVWNKLLTHETILHERIALNQWIWKIFLSKPEGLDLAWTQVVPNLAGFFLFIPQTNLMFHPVGNKL